MSTRAAAFALLVASLVLIGASVAEWALVDVSQTFEGAGDVAVIEQTRVVGGAESAGGLLTVGLLGIVAAVLVARIRRAVLLLVPLAAVGAVVLAAGWPGEGAVTSAPYLAGAALAAYVLVAAAVLVRRAPPAPAAPAASAPSRFTVEAVRGDARGPEQDGGGEAPVDEWDLAVAEDAPPPAPAEDDVRPHPPIDARTPRAEGGHR